MNNFQISVIEKMKTLVIEWTKNKFGTVELKRINRQ